MVLSGLVTTSEAVTTVREESTRNSKSTYSLPKSVTKKNSTTAKGPASNTTEKTYPDGRKVRFKTNTFHTTDIGFSYIGTENLRIQENSKNSRKLDCSLFFPYFGQDIGDLKMD